MSDTHPLYGSAKLTIPGGRHLTQAENCQDHAAKAECEQGVVVAVSDGVSKMKVDSGETVTTHSEVGAVLLAEAAVAGCLRALKAGQGLGAMPEQVATNIRLALGGVWEAIGRRGNHLLPATLLVGVATTEGAIIFGGGDGFFGVILPDWAREGAVIGEGLTFGKSAVGLTVHGELSAPITGDKLPSFGARTSAERVLGQLPVLLRTRIPIVGLHVATDGLVDEDAAAALLRTRVLRGHFQLRNVMARSVDSDDLGLGWIATHSNRTTIEPPGARELYVVPSAELVAAGGVP